MEEVSTIGLDIAKSVFQVHGADATGLQLFNRRITRGKLLGFFASQPRCLVAMEACGGAHHWARELSLKGCASRPVVGSHDAALVARDRVIEPAYLPGVARSPLRVGRSRQPRHQQNRGNCYQAHPAH